MFKIAQDFSICLRCQYRLGVRQGLRSGRRRPARCYEDRRSLTSGTYLQQESSLANDTTFDDGILERAPIRYTTEDLSPNHRSSQWRKTPTKDSLGLNVLGEPAEVLVLPNTQKRFELESAMAKVRASGPDNNPTPVPISSSEMLKKMDAERGLVDIDEVCKNIESVRTLWEVELKGGAKGAAYQDLASRLNKGFTQQQLGFYLSRNPPNPTADVFDLDVEFASSLYARSSWRLITRWPPVSSKARVSKLPNIVPEEPKQKDVFSKRKRHELRKLPKDTLINAILRRCWNIKSRKQESATGELDIRLEHSHLKLILNHKRDILKQISESYDAKVEAWPRAPIVRVTSDYDSCVDVVRILARTLRSIKTSSINIELASTSGPGSMFPRRKLDDATLLQIEKYTNTLVEPEDAPRTSFRVYYIGPDDADLLETRRLIDQMLRPASFQACKFMWSKGDEATDPRPVPVMVGNRLSMLDRRQEWSRWCSPQTNDQTNSKEDEDGNKSSGSLRKSLALDRSSRDTVKSFFGIPDNAVYNRCTSDTPYWTPAIEYHDSVKFGQILFPTNLATSVAKALRRKQTEEGNNRPICNKDVGFNLQQKPREFVPLVPGLVHSIQRLGILKTSEEWVQIRLSPSSENLSLPVPAKALPDLEIRISFDETTKTTSIKDVALVNRQTKDMLQPQNIVDLRFVREKRVYAKNDTIDPSILTFVQNSTLQVWSTEPLKTPLGLTLSVPALAIQPHKDFDPEKHDTLLVQYTSLGFELRSSLTMSYRALDSWPTLTYTTIEAGRIAGRREELELHDHEFTSKPPWPRDPDPSSSSTPHLSTMDTNKSSSDGFRTRTLFSKSAAVIDTIEKRTRGQGKRIRPDSNSSLEMPVDRELWRRREVKKMVRKVDVPVRKKVYRVIKQKAVRRKG